MLKQWCILIVLLSIYSCNRDKDRFKETEDNDLVIQIFRMEQTLQDSGIVNFRLKIIPKKSINRLISKDLHEKLLYRMDSSFYLLEGKNKIYPVLIQSIANGNTRNYEYLISVEADDMLLRKAKLVYQDKYLTKKQYDLTRKK